MKSGPNSPLFCLFRDRVLGKKTRKPRRRQGGEEQAILGAPVRPLTEQMKEAIEQWAEEACEVEGLELIDVEFATPGRWLVRVYAQRPGNPGPGDGITIDECAQVSRYVEALLDVDEQVPESYLLEVSSPGIERTLRKPKHYKQVIGERVRVVTRQAIGNQYSFEGELVEISDGDVITLKLDGGEAIEVEFDGVKKATTVFDFNSL